MTTMRAVQMSEPAGPFERQLPEPARGELRVAVQACGVRRSDMSLIAPVTSIAGRASGTSEDSEDTISFRRVTDVRPMIETMPLERAAEAYDRMMANDARFRGVRTTGRWPSRARITSADE